MKHFHYPPIRFSFATLLISMVVSVSNAQSTSSQALDTTDVANRIIQTTFMAGIGSSNILDTYLSPYSYTGTSARLFFENRRRTTHLPWRGTGYFVHSVELDGSSLNNPAGNVDEYAGGLRYSFAMQYRLKSIPYPFSLAIGPEVSAYVGGIYNELGGNNPAQAKADILFDFSASAAWQFRLLHRDCALRYDLALPIVGAAFSMNYGQSYYEAFSLGQEDHNIVMAYSGNMPSLRHRFTFSMRLGRRSQSRLLLGYGGTLMQAKFNGLRYHSYQHSFLIGFTQSFLKL